MVGFIGDGIRVLCVRFCGGWGGKVQEETFSSVAWNVSITIEAVNLLM